MLLTISVIIYTVITPVQNQNAFRVINKAYIPIHNQYASNRQILRLFPNKYTILIANKRDTAVVYVTTEQYKTIGIGDYYK